MPQYIFTNYTEEYVDKGKTGYHAMTINYSAKGESKQKKVMSFSNPAVYNTIKTLKGGETIDVEFVKDDKYFNWATVKVVETSNSGTSNSGSPAPTRIGGTYETADERARKQVYIIKQSCLAQAVAYVKETDSTDNIDNVLNTAQQFVDWVLHEDKPDLFKEPNDL